jgi:glutathione S-transferase
MIVHGSSISPFVRKVLVFAAEKGLTFENKPTGLGPKSDEFMAISPFGKIPAFEDGDYKLCDSSAIVHYIDAAHPATPLIPADAKARGKVVWFDEYADTIMFAAIAPIFWNRALAPRMKMPVDEAAAAKAEAEAVPPVFDYLESVAPDTGGFLVGDTFSLADIAVCAPLANAGYAGLSIDPAKYPRAAAYAAAILARPSFAALIAADKAMMGF